MEPLVTLRTKYMDNSTGTKMDNFSLHHLQHSGSSKAHTIFTITMKVIQALIIERIIQRSLTLTEMVNTSLPLSNLIDILLDIEIKL